MRNNHGITMLSLVTTIVVLLILSSITVNVNFGIFNVVKVQNFIAELKVIQSKVDNIAEESDENTDYVAKYGFVPVSNLGEEDKNLFMDMVTNPEKYNIDTSNSWNSELDSKIENYYYFSTQDLENKLGLENQELTVIINFKTRNVISKEGIKEDDLKYYRQYDLSSGGERLKN